LAIKKLSGNEEVVNRGEYKKYTNYIVVENIEQFKDLIDSVHSEKMFSFDLETFGFDYLKDDIICMAISFKEGNAIVIPFYKNKKEVWNTGERKIILNRLNKLFNSDLIKIAQNIKFDWHFLKTLGIEVKSPYTDTLLMDYLLDENNRGNRSLEDSAFKVNMGFYDKKFKDYRDKHKIGNYFDMPDDMLWEHNASDADCTLRLYNLYNKQIKKENLELLLNKIVLPLTGVLVEMEHCGVGVDMVYADKLKKKLEEKIGSIELELQMLPEVIDYVDDGWKKAIKESTEKYKGSKMLQNKYSLPDYLEKYVPKEKFKFNFKSPKQLKELLFDRLHLEVIRTTEKGNRSTDSKVLETLQYKSIFCKKLLDHRKLTKLYTTYVANLPEMVKSDGKIHSSFNQAITVTGRLSSQSPNLQNIPKGKLGDYIRNYFIAPENSYFIEADYKQLEYRVWAGYSKDEKMLREISSGKDIHRLIAAEVFQISPDKVTKEQRRMAKSVSFGLMYGRSNKAIAREFNMDVEEASNIAKRFFMGYSKASRWLKNVEWFAKEHKYIVNAYGRKRRLPDINSSNIVKKGHAARQAVNFPIQSMASDITSIATIRVFNKLKEFGFKSKIIMTIHDAIVLEVPRDELNKVIKIIRGEMERPISKVDVPLKVDIQVGKRLGLMKGVGDDNV